MSKKRSLLEFYKRILNEAGAKGGSSPKRGAPDVFQKQLDDINSGITPKDIDVVPLSASGTVKRKKPTEKKKSTEPKTEEEPSKVSEPVKPIEAKKPTEESPQTKKTEEPAKPTENKSSIVKDAAIIAGAGAVLGAGSYLAGKNDKPSAAATPAPTAALSSSRDGVTVVPKSPKDDGVDAPKKAVAPKPQPAPKAPVSEPQASSSSKYAPNTPGTSSARDEDETAAQYWNKEAERNKAEGNKPLPNEFNLFGQGGLFGSKKKVEESKRYLSMNPSSVNMFAEAKKAKKDWDKDGKIESEKDEVWGSRFAAAKKAGKMDEELKGNQDKIDANHNGKIDAQDFKMLRGKKKMNEGATTSDPDFAVPKRPDATPSLGAEEPKFVPKPEEKKPEPVPLPPKRPPNLKEAYLNMLRGKK